MTTFTDVQFMTAAQKTTVLKAWTRFLKNGLQAKDFTKALYHHLIQHCSFIAHYNLGGFYATYFESGDMIVRFLGQFDSSGDRLSVEYGASWWLRGDYADINQAMCEALEPFKANLLQDAKFDQRKVDVAQATQLLAKHGYKLKPVGE